MFVNETPHTYERSRTWFVYILGSILHLNEVDAIVCAVGDDGKGSMTKAVLGMAGATYAQSLKEAR